MPKLSAGIALFRKHTDCVEILLVHPGGPFFKNKDPGSWSLPKGEYENGADPESAAKREFKEETGFELGSSRMIALGEIKQASGKIVTAWAVEGDCEPEKIQSNLFTIEWPPKSGKFRDFPEVDRAGWFSLDAAREKLVGGQRAFLERLAAIVNRPGFSEAEARELRETSVGKTVEG